MNHTPMNHDATLLIQISDSHLLADPGGRVAAVPTGDTLRAVLDYIKENEPEPASIVLTGDLADDESAGSYQRLADYLGPWQHRCRFIPGNHDHPQRLREAFPNRIPGSEGAVTFTERAGDWRLLGCDSNVPGELHGEIGMDQLDWLGDALARQLERPTLVFVHHPPGAVGAERLDTLGLRNPGPLLELLRNAPQVHAVVCGHVHQAFDGLVDGVRMITTPSTAMQFKSGNTHGYTDQPPGYRRFILQRDRFETEPVWLPVLAWPPKREPAH